MDLSSRLLTALVGFSLLCNAGCTSMQELPAADGNSGALPEGDPGQLAASVRARIKPGDRVDIVSANGTERITVVGFDTERIWGERSKGVPASFRYTEIESLSVETVDAGKTLAAGVLATPIILFGALIVGLYVSGGAVGMPY